jgi:DNA-binding MarR family transcriptional regulator
MTQPEQVGGVFLPWTILDALGPREIVGAVVAAAIAQRAQPGSAGWVSTSVRDRAEYTHLTPGQVRRALDALVEVGYLERAIGAGLGRNSYTYRISPEHHAKAVA